MYRCGACTAKIITRVEGQERALARACLLRWVLWGEPGPPEEVVHAAMGAIVFHR